MTDPELNPCAWPVLPCTCGECEPDGPERPTHHSFTFTCLFNDADGNEQSQRLYCEVDVYDYRANEYEFNPQPIDLAAAIEGADEYIHCKKFGIPTD
jgi:hypothetical protein